MTSFELLPIGADRLAPSADLAVAAEQLQAAVLIDEEVTDHRDRVLAFLADHHDAAHRSSVTGHLTGSGLVVDAAGARTLLMLHRKLGRWFQPGGHADGDTNLAAVALREATEETGIGGLRVAVPAIDVDVHRVAIPGEAAHLHLDTRFLVVAPPGAREQANEESLDLRWVDLAEVATLTPPVDPSTRRLVAGGLEVAATVGG
jgi:8-oxo-dGTP pyrophosphatase MutT (NUDIX family)